MKTNTLANAVALSDQDLLSRVQALVGDEREATAELVAHLAALELRSSVYAALGYGSLFAYCTEALHLSEDAACNRIDAARTCRSFPVILDLLASGSLTLTAVRKLGKHLTPENYETVLSRAKHQKKEQIDALVAELAPKPDVVSSVRKLPASMPTSALEVSASSAAPLLAIALTDPAGDSGPADAIDRPAPQPVLHAPTPLTPPRPVLQALAPGRYRVQFTVGQEGYDKLRRLQTLLRREVPNGDAGVIFERFIDVLLEKIERDKLGTPGKATATGRKRRSMEARGGGDDHDPRATSPAYENRIRSGTDGTSVAHMPGGLPSRKAPSRYIPNAVKRAVWFRDRGQCAFVAEAGHRCSERSFLHVHHIQPYALDGPATVGNLSLRCPRHNQYEAELVFGRPPRE